MATLRLRHRVLAPAPLAAAIALAVMALGGAALGSPPPTLAESPPPAATPAPATCADRFPAEGPAGVDLRLGCVVGELVGLYTASSAGEPTPISFYFIALFGGIVGALVVAWLAMRLVVRRAGRRMAPVLPGAWWVCDRCHSVNGADVQRCYACGAAASTGTPMPTIDRPETPQSFGDRGRR